jgi:hypothetical protein
MCFYLMLHVTQWWASRPDLFNTEESAPGHFGQKDEWSTQPIWSLQKIFCSCQKLSLDPTIFQFLA